MTEDSAPVLPAELVRYVQCWADSVSQALSQIANSAVPCTISTQAPTSIAPPTPQDLWFLCTCSGAVRGESILRMNPASASRAAQMLIGEPSSPEAQLTGEHKAAVLELLRQFAGLVSSALRSRWGEVQLHVEEAAGPASWTSSASLWLRSGTEPDGFVIELQLSAALSTALRAEQPVTADAASATSTPPSSPALAASPGSSSSSPTLRAELDEKKLGLLLDVELAMTLRFGTRRLLLREILELSPGSVLELDRQVQDPVDMLLDGRLVARGEVVVIGGNLGLQVTEVVPASGI